MDKEISDKILKAVTVQDIEQIRVEILGKKGFITEKMKGLGALSPEERKLEGQKLNLLKTEIEEAISSKKQELELKAINEKLESEKVDITLPIRQRNVGRIHPVSQTMEEMISILGSFGFALAEGPDIEDDFHNFQALNIPESHPARQMQATFFIEGEEGVVLRTHTSPVQVRTMEKGELPIKIIAPGRVYRCDWDMTHTPLFHQIEGLVIDKKTNMGDLKGCLIEFVKKFFEMDEVPVRFRPSFFPFTEPSAEMDIGCSRENGEFKIEANKGWMEVLGCGMVHPNVLKNSGIDPEEYQGFAFGFGIDRFAMLKYGIPDLRDFFEGDIRWIKHYGFLPLDVPNVATGLSLNGGVK
ncbi:MAG: Phenylalanine--tRNA ligase alpha subunit [Alphaproteobacteria bacterium ADurb.Bin438]|nr:MAG: Phenylalanine--tRNA ligase alpha subunit [Alphaproteobacteria bacterium ADurb.Bin438]